MFKFAAGFAIGILGFYSLCATALIAYRIDMEDRKDAVKKSTPSANLDNAWNDIDKMDLNN